ncbi:UvrB/UvrC motif-containing protein, partial [Rhodopirellula bahusiensis]
ADKEGFLRSETSLIQTIGRAARNANSRVILYADKVTNSMQLAIDETERRRVIQMEYNAKHGIVPKTVRKSIRKGIDTEAASHKESTRKAQDSGEAIYITIEYVDKLEQEMLSAAEDLEFERAARLRDRVLQLKEHIGKPLSDVEIVDEKSAGKSGGRGRRGAKKKGASKGTKIPRPKRG